MVGVKHGLKAHIQFVNKFNEMMEKHKPAYNTFCESYKKYKSVTSNPVYAQFSYSAVIDSFPLFLENEILNTVIVEDEKNLDKGYKIFPVASEEVLETQIYELLVDWDLETKTERQVILPNGRADIVLVDLVENKKHIIELKKDVAGIEAVSQVLGYAKGLSENEYDLSLIALGFTEEAIEYAFQKNVYCLKYEMYANEVDSFLTFEEITFERDEEHPIKNPLFIEDVSNVRIDYSCKRKEFPTVNEGINKSSALGQELLDMIEEYKFKIANMKQVCFNGKNYYLTDEEVAALKEQLD